MSKPSKLAARLDAVPGWRALLARHQPSSDTPRAPSLATDAGISLPSYDLDVVAVAFWALSFVPTSLRGAGLNADVSLCPLDKDGEDLSDVSDFYFIGLAAPDEWLAVALTRYRMHEPRLVRPHSNGWISVRAMLCAEK